MFVGTVKVKLSKPYPWEDRQIEFVELDFSKVTGAVVNQCERETFQQGNMSGLVRNMSAEYCARMAALISGVPFRFLEKLLHSDYDTIWQTVGAYLGNNNPQKFYNQFTADSGDDEDEGFTEPAKPAKPAQKQPEK